MDNQQPSLKQCRTCGKIRPTTDFYRRGILPNGEEKRDKDCKDCRRPIEAALAKKRYAKNPEMYRAYVKNYRLRDPERSKAQDRAQHRKKKLMVMEAYGGAFCACCGIGYFSMLTIDHMNNDGAKHRAEIGNGKKNIGSRLYQWLITNKFPPGFQVLCYNCNSSKHINGGVCEHKLKEGSTTIP